MEKYIYKILIKLIELGPMQAAEIFGTPLSPGNIPKSIIVNFQVSISTINLGAF